MKKLITTFIIAVIAVLGAASASAKDMNMYINGMYSTQDVQSVGGFDMLPAEDIAGYLGFTSYFDGYTLTLYGTDRTYSFHVGDAVVTDNAGGWYGLDITPRVIDGKIRIPAKFFSDAFGMTYTWDWVTDTLFLNSDYTYNWLINTWEYQTDKYNKLNSVSSKQDAIDRVYKHRISTGEIFEDYYLSNVYKAEEYSNYYLVKVTATEYADGQSRYKVYKSGGRIEYIGCASDWTEEGDFYGVRPY